MNTSSKIFTLSNCLSLARFPLAFAFLLESSLLRITAIALAMITDSIDGYIARRSKSTSRFGAALDPLMDKFFVYFGIATLLIESKLLAWQALAMISRDFFLIVFALYLITRRSLRSYEYKSIRWGKVSTALQFFVLIALCAGVMIPASIYYIFIGIGSLAFAELIMRLRMC